MDRKWEDVDIGYDEGQEVMIREITVDETHSDLSEVARELLISGFPLYDSEDDHLDEL